MRRSRLSLGLVGVAACALGACDSGEDPRPAAQFRTEDPFARVIGGRVFRGIDGVEAAVVRVDASPGYQDDAVLAAKSTLERATSTDAAGTYRVQFAPFRYDLSVAQGRELFVLRRLAGRYIEPQLGDDGVGPAYQVTLSPVLSPPPSTGDATAVLVSGLDARSVAVVDGRVVARIGAFDTRITVHVLEYVARDGLANLVRSGKAEVAVRDGQSVAPTVPMADVVERRWVTFTGDVPAGYAGAPLEVAIDGGLRTSAAVIARATLGVPVLLPKVPGVGYTVRGQASSVDGVSSTGRQIFDVGWDKVVVTYPAPVSAEAPIDDAALALGPATHGLAPYTLLAGGALSVRLGKGVVEHVLTPASGDGPVVRVVTSDRSTTLPDPTESGLPRPVGRYAWSFEHFPTIPFVDRFSGRDVRVFVPSWRSAARELVLP